MAMPDDGKVDLTKGRSALPIAARIKRFIKSSIPNNPTTKTLLVVMLCFVISYQSIMLWVWSAFPQYDWILLRFSLSNSDAISIYALALSFVAYHLYERSGQNEDVVAMRKFAKVIRPIIDEVERRSPKREDGEIDAVKVVDTMLTYERKLKDYEAELTKWKDRAKKLEKVVDSMGAALDKIPDDKLEYIVGVKLGGLVGDSSGSKH